MALFNPFIGLKAYICFAIIRPPEMWFWSVPPGNYSRIVAIAMLIGWGLHGFGGWQFGRARAIVWAFVGFYIWAILSAMNSPNQEVAWHFIETMGKILIPFLVGMTLVDSIEKLKQLAWVIMLSQGYVAYEMNLSYFSGYNRVWDIGFGSMDNNGVAIAMVTGMGLAFFLGISATKWWTKGLAFFAAILMAHTVMLAFSRGGLVAMIVTMIVAFVMLPSKNPKHVVAFVIMMVIGLRLAGPEVTDRFFTIFSDRQARDQSAESRLELWEDNWDLMKRHPLLGVGPDHWPLVAPEYGWELGKEGHSLWLQIGAELGFPGLALLMSFYGLCLFRLWPLARSKTEVPDPWLHDAARMVIAAHVGFAISAQFVSVEGLELPYYVSMLGAGALKLMPSPAVLASQVRVPVSFSQSSLALRKA